MVPFVDLQGANARYRQELLAAFTRVLDSGSYVLGGEGLAFESEFAAYCGVRHSAGVGSGLGALSLVLRAWKELGRLREGDEVILLANTFISTVLAVTENRLKPVLVEPDPLTFNIDVERAAAAITERTRVILPVHLYGRLADMPAVMQLAEAHGLMVLEDAAQAHGAAIDARRAGSFGHAAAFSFYPAKNLGALGDAGAVTSDDADLIAVVRALRNTGSAKKYANDFRGDNCRLDEMQAAFLRVKLAYLEADNALRRRVAAIYGSTIVSNHVALPQDGAPGQHVWHLYVARVDGRDRMKAYLGEAGVQTQIHYPVPPHRQVAYADSLGHLSLPVTERLHDEVLSLPIGPTMAEVDAFAVADAVNRFPG